MGKTVPGQTEMSHSALPALSRKYQAVFRSGPFTVGQSVRDAISLENPSVGAIRTLSSIQTDCRSTVMRCELHRLLIQHASDVFRSTAYSERQ